MRLNEIVYLLHRNIKKDNISLIKLPAYRLLVMVKNCSLSDVVIGCSLRLYCMQFIES